MQNKQVRLRPVRRADSKLLYQWITDRNLFILNAPYWPISEADHETWVESMMTKSRDHVLFVIEENSTKRAIGTCQLTRINYVHRSAELQIRIGDPFLLSRGFGTQAIRLLLAFGFNDLNMHRIFLHVFITNTRAIRAYEKAGFVREGVLRQAAYIDGRFVDVLIMSKLGSEHNKFESTLD